MASNQTEDTEAADPGDFMDVTIKENQELRLEDDEAENTEDNTENNAEENTNSGVSIF